MGDMSETPHRARSPEQALSALEQALRDALEVVGPERALRVVRDVFPAEAGPGTIEIDTSRFHGRVQKVSVSMPEELTVAVRERTGPGGFSRFVAEATEKRLRGELLDEYLDELDEIYGPVPHELMEQARREWPDYEGE
jgi:acetylornithine deacetylase/succinyl-diaminopimelate desuccinylase-like protein